MEQLKRIVDRLELGFRLAVQDGTPEPVHQTDLGALFHGDCLEILPSLSDQSVNTIFADPPFNLGKTYGARVNDNRNDVDYLGWCHRWIDECVRVLKPGGDFFLYNLPRWNIPLGDHLMQRGMTFRHWIAISMKAILPIPGRLYPAHYSLLYYSKGRPKTFRTIRTPIQTCRHCGGEVKDYGGHRGAMNPNGVNLMDVWDDIPPVRHRKFKSPKRRTNQLSTKLLRRVVELTTHQGDIVLDPFGGSGTTFDVCERTGCRWIGIEVENCDAIVERLTTGRLRPHESTDWVDGGA